MKEEIEEPQEARRSNYGLKKATEATDIIISIF